MTIEIDKYYLVSKILLGINLKLFLQNHLDNNDRKVLELKEVVGIIENSLNKEQLKILRIDDNGNSYAHDLSLRLQNAEIKTFKEVFIFTDANCVNYCFRASARSVDFRDWTQNDIWL